MFTRESSPSISLVLIYMMIFLAKPKINLQNFRSTPDSLKRRYSNENGSWVPQLTSKTIHIHLFCFPTIRIFSGQNENKIKKKKKLTRNVIASRLTWARGWLV